MKRPMSRRAFVRNTFLSTLALAGGLGIPKAFGATGKKTELTADQALELLKKGNEEYLSDNAAQRKTRERRQEIARGQAPFAVFVSCSDSRVPPEILFNRSLGELFIIRNAGNTVDTAALGSIEYGVAMLGAPLVVVLGHERCGAVDAAISVAEKNTSLPGSLGPMIEPIIPAVLVAKGSGDLKGEELLDAAVRENVRRVVNRLKTSPAILQEHVKGGKVKVVGARYDLDDGKVDFFAQ